MEERPSKGGEKRNEFYVWNFRMVCISSRSAWRRSSSILTKLVPEEVEVR